MMKTDARPHGLSAITPDWTDTQQLLTATEDILGAGCRILQYRNKQATEEQRQDLAVALRGLTRN